MKGSRALVLLLPLLWVVVACDRGHPARMLHDYAARVARASNQPVVPLEWPSPLAYPSHRDRQLAAPEVRARLLELDDFNRCNLTQLVAERNSILGRYWPASQRLDYELRFAHRLDRCRTWLHAQPDDTADPEWRDRLDAIAADKAGTIPAVWWQVTFDSDEFSQHFSAANDWVRADDAPPMAELGWLAARGRALQPPPDGLALPALEQRLQQIALNGFGGGWLRSVQGMTLALNRAADHLQAIDLSRLCPQERPTPRARILETVFYRYYAARVQPYLAQLHRDGSAWQAAQQALLRTAPPPPPAFSAFARLAIGDHRGSLWQALAVARERHTEAWQTTLGHCGLMPGSAGANPAD